jgi:hypothetical protein
MAGDRMRPETRAGGPAAASSLARMDVPPPDPQKLLASWMEWERGEVPPGRVMSNLKTAGLRTLLEQLAAAASSAAVGAAPDASSGG